MMIRYTTTSEFYYKKKQFDQSNNYHSQPIINGSLAEEADMETCPIICRAPSRTWWEQAWHIKRRY